MAGRRTSGQHGETRRPPMTDDRNDHERGGWLWKIERIEERQRDILNKLERIITMLEAIIQRSEERGWKIDSILAEQTRVAREMLETLSKRSGLAGWDTSNLVKLALVLLAALAAGRVGSEIIKGLGGGG